MYRIGKFSVQLIFFLFFFLGQRNFTLSIKKPHASPNYLHLKQRKIEKLENKRENKKNQLTNGIIRFHKTTEQTN